MILLNFAHPITDEQLATIEAKTGRPIERIINRQPHFENNETLIDQVRKLVDSVELSADEWQTQPLLINPPGLAPAALCVLADIHGRAGYFPFSLWIRLAANSASDHFEVAEVLNLQEVRDQSRGSRSQY